MATMKNAEAVARLNVLRDLEKLNISLPTVVGYRIVQNLRALQDVLVAYNDMRNKIIQKYAKDGKTIRKDEDPAAYEACEAEIEELNQLDVSVDVQTFPFSSIADKELPLNTMFALEFMIDKTK